MLRDRYDDIFTVSAPGEFPATFVPLLYRTSVMMCVYTCNNGRIIIIKAQLWSFFLFFFFPPHPHVAVHRLNVCVWWFRSVKGSNALPSSAVVRVLPPFVDVHPLDCARVDKPSKTGFSASRGRVSYVPFPQKLANKKIIALLVDYTHCCFVSPLRTPPILCRFHRVGKN